MKTLLTSSISGTVISQTLLEAKLWAARLCSLTMLSAACTAGSLAIGSLPAYALEFPDTGDRGAPERTAGGGTRGGLCDYENRSQPAIKALVPRNNVHTFAGEQASLFLHLAPGFEQQQAEIYVQDPRTQTAVYQTQMSLDALVDNRDSDSGSIFEVTIPTAAENGPVLEPDQPYFWEFAVICNPDDRTQDYVVQGLMTSVSTSAELTELLENASPEQQPALYAEAGIWQETLKMTHNLRESDSQLWSKLLASVGLDEIATIPYQGRL